MVRTVEATRRMERNGRSRHILCGVPCKAPQPPESPRERYGLGDALTGAIHSLDAVRVRVPTKALRKLSFGTGG
jgi:hypothetical protein